MVAISFSAFSQKRVLWYADGVLAEWETPLKDSLIATGDFVILAEKTALEFSAMNTANNFLIYDLVIMNESGPSSSGVNYGNPGAGFPKPLLSIEPYTFDDWFGVTTDQQAGVANTGKNYVDPLQKFIVKAPHHPIFTSMLSAPDAYDTITWTTNWNTVGGLGEAHVAKIHLDDATEIASDATLIASMEELEREDPVEGKDNGLMWAVEENSVTNRIFLMGGHVMWLEFATPAYWHLLINAAYWCVGLEVPAVNVKPSISNKLGITLCPQPNNGSFKLTLNIVEATNADISIFDVTGRAVESFKYSLNSGIQDINFDTGLPSGIYFITVETNKGMSVQKFNVK